MYDNKEGNIIKIQHTDTLNFCAFIVFLVWLRVLGLCFLETKEISVNETIIFIANKIIQRQYT